MGLLSVALSLPSPARIRASPFSRRLFFTGWIWHRGDTAAEDLRVSGRVRRGGERGW